MKALELVPSFEICMQLEMANWTEATYFVWHGEGKNRRVSPKESVKVKDMIARAPIGLEILAALPFGTNIVKREHIEGTRYIVTTPDQATAAVDKSIANALGLVYIALNSPYKEEVAHA